ncbi:MAG: hypothetical protein H6707_01565 [Deltaproteobacteria bacterium]|nr:hypothetical protein [Deltaproteobacteria bacterium]
MSVRPAVSCFARSLFVLGCSLTIAACGAETDTSSNNQASCDPAKRSYAPPLSIDVSDFVTDLDAATPNPLFPLVAGTTQTYLGGGERIVVEVLPETRVVMGITARVVRDRVYIDGELYEDTIDWYAQDKRGNVWYMGEETADYENGAVVSTAGSWESGVQGAQPGIYMWSDPRTRLDQAYFQEFWACKAEDQAKVIEVDKTVTVPSGTYQGCMVTEDWNPLEGNASREHKTYCPGVGFVLETKVATGSQVALVEAVLPAR